MVFFSCKGKTENTTILFNKEVHDFGKIKLDKKANTIFLLTNTGSRPLFISKVETTCGCTVPEWGKGKILPNETRELKVVFDANNIGLFSAGIFVYYNGYNSPKKIFIEGNVEYFSLLK